MKCKCGSNEHKRTSSKSCKLYAPRKKPPDNVDGQEFYNGCHTVYKTGIETLCQPTHKDVIVETVKKAVKNITQISFEGSRFFEMYLLYHFENDIDHLISNTLFDTSTIRSFFTIMASKTYDNAPDWMKQFHETHYNILRDENFKPANLLKLGQCVTYIVKEYEVNLDNHLKKSSEYLFLKKLKKLFLDIWGVSKSECHTICTHIMEKELNEKYFEDNPHIRPFFDEWGSIKQNRLSRMTFIYRQNKHNFRMNGFRNSFNILHKVKIPSLVPLFTWEAKYITLDTDSIYQLFRHLDFFGNTISDAGKNQQYMWSTLFKIPNRLFNDEINKDRFNFMIKTDGVGTSVHKSKWKPVDMEFRKCKTSEEKRIYIKNKQIEKAMFYKEQISLLCQKEGVRYCGIDPGVKTVMTVVNENMKKTSTSKKKKHEYPGKRQFFKNNRYYTDSKFNYKKHKSELYLSRDGLLKWALNTPPVGTGFVCYQDKLRYLLNGKFFDAMITTRCSKQYSKLKWKSYIHNKITVNKFCSEIIGKDDPEKLVVCFGDASYNSSMKGNKSSPKQMRFVKEFRRLKTSVFMTPEFNTSLVCSKCKTCKRLTKRDKIIFPYSVRKCTLTTCGMVWNRDVNAAVNMLTVGKSLLMNGEKPSVFSHVLPKKKKKGVVGAPNDCSETN